MMKDKLCIIIGAGASRSLTSNDDPGLIGVGRHSAMPLGADLIKRIASYRKKSITWYLSYILFQLIHDFNSRNQTKYFEFAETIERYLPDYREEEKISKNKVEQFIDSFKKNFESLKEPPSNTVSFSMKIDKDGVQTNIDNLSFSKRKLLSDIFCNSRFLKRKFDFICSQKENGHRIFESIITLLVIQEFISSLNENKLKKLRRNKYYSDSIFEAISIKVDKVINGVALKLSGSIKKTQMVNNTIQVNSIWEQSENLLKELKSNIAEALENPTLNPKDEILKFIDYLNKVIEDMSSEIQIPINNQGAWEYILGYRFFNRISYIETIDTNKTPEANSKRIDSKKFLKVKSLLEIFKKKYIDSICLEKINLFIFILKRYGFSKSRIFDSHTIHKSDFLRALLKEELKEYNFTENHTTQHMESIFKVTSLIYSYQPPSIDYFMMNLEYFTPYEFYGIETEKEKKERVKIIHTYTKYLLANEILYSATYAYIAKENTYIDMLLYHINVKSHFAGVSVEQYLRKNVQIINFNYDNLLDRMLYESTDKSFADDFIKNNIQHMYGKLDLYTKENIPIFDIQENGLWEAIFLSYENANGYIDKIKVRNNSLGEGPIGLYECNNLLEQCNTCIKWITENKNIENQREKYKSYLREVREIYFLGFGFDKNNLYQIGIINKENKLDLLEFTNDIIKIFVSQGNSRIVAILAGLFHISNIRKIENVYYGNKTDKVEDSSYTIGYNNLAKINLFISLDSLEKALSSQFPY